jgi:hypothetical protein
MHLLTSIYEAVPAVVVTPLDSAPAVVAVEVRVSVGVPSAAAAVPAATTAAAAVSGRSADAPALPPATEITGRIGLVRAEDSTGCVVAIDGHWFDVADILAEPDVGLVQLHGVSSGSEFGKAPARRERPPTCRQQ